MKALWPTILILLTASLFADNTCEEIADDMKCIPQAAQAGREKGFIPAAYTFYTPETNVGFGTALLLFHSRPKAKPDQIGLNAIYTLNKQISIVAYTYIYFQDSKYLLSADLKYEKYPQDFYGIGIDVPDAPLSTFIPQIGLTDFTFSYRIAKDTYIGPRFFFLTTDEPSGCDDCEWRVREHDPKMIYGTGLELSSDSRNSAFYPTTGHWLALDYKYQDEYSVLTTDLRKYSGLGGDHVLAGQFFFSGAEGKIPFTEYPQLGGSKTMRGYDEGKFRDDIYIAAQLEYRYPIWKRLGGVAFISGGTVAPKIDKIEHILPAAGLGFRFTISKKQHINLRADFAYGEDGLKFYITSMEAF